MAAPAEPGKLKFCPYFSNGRYCPLRRECPLIHKWALYNSATRQRELAKCNQNQGDAGNKTCAQEHANTSINMRHGENIKLGESGKGTSVNIQDADVTQTVSAVPEQNQRPVEGRQSSNSRMFQGKNRRKTITESVDHDNVADPFDNIRKTVENIPSFNLNEPLPDRSSIKYIDGKITGKAFHSRSFLGPVNQSVSGNMTAPSIKIRQPRHKWPKAPKAPKRNGAYAGHSHTMITEASNGPYTYRDLSSPTALERKVGYAGICQAMIRAASNGPYTYHDLSSPYEEVRIARMQFYGYAAQKASPYETKESETLRMFTLFPELPFEIRLVIWKVVINFPHNPVVRFVPVRDHRGDIVFRDILCNSKAPIALQINQESRKEALKQYTMVFDNTTYLRKTGATLYLDTDEPGDINHFVAAVSGRDLRVIENLAVRLFEWCWMDGTFGEAIQEFPNLKRLLMMFTKSDDSPYLNRATLKKINKELRESAVSRVGWKVPYIGLVPSGEIEAFLKRTTFA